MGIPPPGTREHQGLFKALPAQRLHHGKESVSFHCRRARLDPEVMGSCRGQQALQAHGGGGAHGSHPPQPHDTPALGPKPAQAPGYKIAVQVREVKGDKLGMAFFFLFLFFNFRLMVYWSIVDF